MRVKRVEWSRQAQRDAADSADWYVEQEGLALGERFLAQVHATLVRLRHFPAIGSTRHAECIANLPAPLRFVRVAQFEHHLVYYIDLPEHIEVIRVWHAARGLEALLGDEEPQPE